MRAVLPLAVLGLAACDGPLEELFPPRFYSFDRAGITYEARAQFDPFEMGWFVRILSIEAPLEAEDVEIATRIAEADLGPLLCDGNALDVEPGGVWNPLAGSQVAYMEDLDAWHLVGRCTDAPPPPDVFPAQAVWPGAGQLQEVAEE